MKNEEFALECRRRYVEDGLVVDASNGEFAHCPLPRGMGDTGYYLLHDDHQWQGLLQSKDVGKKCFYEYQARRFLVEGPFVEGYFDLWDIYETFSGNRGVATGKAAYRDPETGETALLTPDEAEGMGWVHVNKGKSMYRNPETGENQKLAPAEAKSLGWMSVFSGRSCFRDPESGQTALLTTDEAKQRGWVSANAGTSLFRNPESGEVARMTPQNAEERGWVGVNKGRHFRQEEQTCLHCGKVGKGSAMTRYHFDNCKHRQE